MDIKEKINNTPASPGVYLFKDKDARVIYVGKAASIRKRLKGHFAKAVDTRHKALLEAVADIDYILTPDEPAALLLEAALVKKYAPKYNVMLRDDKSYPRLKLTVNEEYPRLFITRKIKPDGAVYFGPYTDAKLLRRAVTFMKRIFPLRTCAVMAKKPCLNFHIGLCLAPCINKDKKQDYMSAVEQARLFLGGEREELIEKLTAQMKNAAENKDFESAGRIRDRVRALSLVGIIPEHGAFPDKEMFYPAQQLGQLGEILSLPKPPAVIEAFDVSNISGKEAAGSMVSFKDGKPYRNDYRRFKIRTVPAMDDYSMMREIVSRRYKRLLWEGKALPDLVVIDGGKGHLAAAKQELLRLKLWKLPVISIAKNPDRIFVSEAKEPLLLGNFGAALLLVQRIRDEAHRFAITYHRALRSKKLASSELDDIKGIGPKKKASLISHFGSIDGIKAADIEELTKAKYINEKEAKVIYNYFRS